MTEQWRECYAFANKTTMTKTPHALPLLDIRWFYSNQAYFVEALRSACHNVGFFVLKHDLPPTLIQEQLDVATAFFALPLDEKLRISYENSPSFRGYMKLGVENTAGQTDHREQLEYAVEYDPPYPSDPPYMRLRGKNPWPNDSMERVCKEYAREVCRIADCIRISLGLALQVDSNDALAAQFTKPDEPPHWVIKLISYPPAATRTMTSDTIRNQGVGAHTDTNFLTLVLQHHDGAGGGLQVFSNGEWVDIGGSTNDVLICNLGEQTEVWSRGYFLATPHRVLLTPSTQRISIPLFYNPPLSTQIQPVDYGDNYNDDNNYASSVPAPKWERPMLDQQDHWRSSKNHNNVMLTSVGENTFKSLARSHPKVFAKHHGDLTLLSDGRIVPRDTTDFSGK